MTNCCYKNENLIGSTIGIIGISIFTTLFLCFGIIWYIQESQQINASNGQSSNCTVVYANVVPLSCKYQLTFAYNGQNYTQTIPFGIKSLDPFILNPDDMITCWSADFDDPVNLVVVNQIFSYSTLTLFFLIFGIIMGLVLISFCIAFFLLIRDKREKYMYIVF